MKIFKNIYRNFVMPAVVFIPLVTVLSCASNSGIPEEQKDLQDVQTILDKFNNVFTKNNKVLPNEKELQNITFDLLDIDNPISDNLGTKISLNLQKVSPKRDEITIKVTVRKNKAQDSKMILISGFKIIINQNEEAVNFILSAFNRKQGTKWTQCFPIWKVKEKVKVQDLGISEPNNDQNVILEYEILGIDHAKGKVYAKVYARKNDFEKSFQIIIKDFLKTTNFLQQLATIIQSRNETIFSDTFPHQILEKNVDKDEVNPRNDLGIEPLSLQELKIATVRYYIENISDIAGTINIKIKISIYQRQVLAEDEEDEEFIKDQETIIEDNQTRLLSRNFFFKISKFKRK